MVVYQFPPPVCGEGSPLGSTIDQVNKPSSDPKGRGEVIPPTPAETHHALATD